MPLTLILGGARSGKSAHAVTLAGEARSTTTTFIATAPHHLDADLDERIERHVADRPSDWTTVEAPIELADAIRAAADGVVIVDCLSLWTSNLMAAGHDDHDIEETARRCVHVAAERHDEILVVSNEVGLGVHPTSDLGRRYRDVHGRVNQLWAARADVALLLVAGRAMRLT
jgi:adenosyl cobinamide kinase/adenosyl cobinamide phosphate guanylyltransferase